MSDLIERLRLCERNGKRHVGELAGEAADEIERLTVLLEARDVVLENNVRRIAKLEAIVDAAMALSEKYWAEEVRSTYKELESLRIKIAALKEAK